LATVFARARAEALQVLPVTRDNSVTAARFAERFSLGLRATDALQVVIAGKHGATICILDRRLAEAATALAVSAAII
jgi:uncharacterized protein